MRHLNVFVTSLPKSEREFVSGHVISSRPRSTVALNYKMMLMMWPQVCLSETTVSLRWTTKIGLSYLDTRMCVMVFVHAAVDGNMENPGKNIILPRLELKYKRNRPMGHRSTSEAKWMAQNGCSPSPTCPTIFIDMNNNQPDCRLIVCFRERPNCEAL